MDRTKGLRLWYRQHQYPNEWCGNWRSVRRRKTHWWRPREWLRLMETVHATKYGYLELWQRSHSCSGYKIWVRVFTETVFWRITMYVWRYLVSTQLLQTRSEKDLFDRESVVSLNSTVLIMRLKNVSYFF